MILRGEKIEQHYLEVLRRHFHVMPFEKHPDAMISLFFDEACNKILGSNYRKKRVSRRNAQRVKDNIRSRLKHKYGEYANITNFRMKSLQDIRYATNFHLMFNVRDLGALFAIPFSGFGVGLLFTTHCLERLQERGNSTLMLVLNKAAEQRMDEEPTTIDIVSLLIMKSGLEYGRWKDFYYLNVGLGAFVLERYEDIFVVKTFLTEEMLPREVKWYRPLYDPGDYDPHGYFATFAEFVDTETIEVKKPGFFNPQEIKEREEEIYGR